MLFERNLFLILKKFLNFEQNVQIFFWYITELLFQDSFTMWILEIFVKINLVLFTFLSRKKRKGAIFKKKSLMHSFNYKSNVGKKGILNYQISKPPCQNDWIKQNDQWKRINDSSVKELKLKLLFRNSIRI